MLRKQCHQLMHTMPWVPRIHRVQLDNPPASGASFAFGLLKG